MDLPSPNHHHNPSTPMNLAIDYDDTWTKDPYLWDTFVGIALHRGHQVFIATGRSERDELVAGFDVPRGIRVIYCDRDYKEQVLLRNGIKIDVWIDDSPGCIQQTKILGGEL